RLSGISHTCSHFQTFPKPYKDIIDLYSVKIEQIFGILSAASATVVAKTQPAKKESDLIDNETNTAPEAQTMLPTDSDRYYISKDFQQSGPFGRDKLITMLNDGLVSYDFYVSLNGISDWKPIGDVVPAQAAMPETISDKKEVDSVWNRHYKTGIACAHLTPERAVVELTKAIQLNPNNAEQYYFRGIAYQKTNKFTAALQDFEKAHKLSPNTDKYSNALEKARKDNKQK
ncbi:MAG: tetratricopeptide repeat protein, partial [Spirochaetaceae bacterium]|nr:tetratricopeptide repeat protein [Spirochaetaceae bacterium]